MICKNCIHYDVCQFFLDEGTIKTVFDCFRFKPKSRFIELPCEVGQKVYSINRKASGGHWEEGRYIVDKWDSFKVCEIPFSLTLWECGWKDIFLTKEEAEKALEERNKK